MSSPRFPPSSPSTRYQSRIDHNNNNDNSNDQQSHPTELCLDRLSPSHRGSRAFSISFFDSKRFIHSGSQDNINQCDINQRINRHRLSLSTSARKRKKRLLEFADYYVRGRLHRDVVTNKDNHDITWYNERMQERNALQTYNHCLKSELFQSQRSSNNISEDDTPNDYNERINNGRYSFDFDSSDSDKHSIDSTEISLFQIPSLPTFRSSIKESVANPAKISHHPLCPRFEEIQKAKKLKTTRQPLSERKLSKSRLSESSCACPSITSNVKLYDLRSPQRTLQYKHRQNIKDNDTNTCSPLTVSSQKSLISSRQSFRSISKAPYKILDAPRLTDDFYLNLLSLSSSCNLLSVGLAECVYLWNPRDLSVTLLCDLNKLNLAESEDEDENDISSVCSVGWNENRKNQSIFTTYTNTGNKFVDYLGVGTNAGFVLIYDVSKRKLIRNLVKHNHRVGVLSWKDDNVLVTGSRDRHIAYRDIRQQQDVCHRLLFHKQEVCGLEWSCNDSYYLASGGNDNRLAIWDIRKCVKPCLYGKHRAAIKAIAWSPHTNGLLCSGGGTACRCIKFWNVNDNHASNADWLDSEPHQMKPGKILDTGSQVCNLLWSRNVDEIVSTHGYSLNQIVVWKYPEMAKVCTLTGHTYRVLYLSGSADGQTIVTGAADQTLRLWNVFPPASSKQNKYHNDNNNRVQIEVSQIR